MDNREAAALCHLAGAVVAEVTTAVEGVHLGVLSRVRAATGSPTVDVVQGHTRAVYGIINRASAGASAVAAASAAALVDPAGPPLDTTRRGATWLAALQAAIGDRLHDDPRTEALAGSVCFRSDGRVVPPAEVALHCAEPAVGVAVLIHGLAGTEYQWGERYPQRLAEQGFAVAQVRHNGGRPIMDNGSELAALLGDLVDALAPQRRRLLLVGHSMGGLIIRSAIAAAPPGAAWVRAVSDVVTLGTPHRGAPLEQAAAFAMAGLQRFRESGPIAQFGNQRAQGIKDLRFGAVLPGHWGGRHPDEVLCATIDQPPLPVGIREHAVVATLGAPGSLVGRVLGDGLVRRSSAIGGGAVHHLHDTGHMRLLDDPRVADILAQVAAAPG